VIGQPLVQLASRTLAQGLLDLFRGRHRLPGELDLGVAQHPFDPREIPRRHQQDTASGATRAARSTGTMGVGVGFARRVHVDHRRDVGDVDPARSNLGGNEDRQRAMAEGRERPRSLRLGKLAAEGRRTESIGGQLLRQLRSIHAPVHEEQAALSFGHEQHIHEGRVGLVPADRITDVLDVDVGRAQTRTLENERLTLEALRQIEHTAGKGRRDEMTGPLGRQRLQDRVELLAEAHVEHLIRLVEHDVRDRVGGDGAVPQMIEQATRCPDHELRAPCQRSALIQDRGAPRHHFDAQTAQVGIEPGELVSYLRRQLPRRHDQQRARMRDSVGGPATDARPPRRARGLSGRRHRPRRRIPVDRRRRQRLQEVIREGEPDRYGLARTRLRRNAQVTALRLRRNDGLLNSGERVESAALERSGEGVGQARESIGGHGVSGKRVRLRRGHGAGVRRLRIDRTGMRKRRGMRAAGPRRRDPGSAEGAP